MGLTTSISGALRATDQVGVEREVARESSSGQYFLSRSTRPPGGERSYACIWQCTTPKML